MSILDSRLFGVPIAHRGLHNEEFPENSLGAFENAVKHGFPIEFDIQIINDDTVVVFHDYKLERMTGLDGYVSTLNKERLKDVRLLGSEFSLPTLEQVLQTVNGKVPLLIEIKNEGQIGSLEKHALEMLNSYAGEYAVQSFNPYSVGYFKQNAPQILRGQLATKFTKADVPNFFKRKALTRMALNKKVSSPDFISYCADFLPNKTVSATSLPVLAWTVRSKAQADKLKGHCDNIIFEKYIPDEDE